MQTKKNKKKMMMKNVAENVGKDYLCIHVIARGGECHACEKKYRKMWKGKCEAIYDAAGFNLFHYSDTYK